MSIKDKRSSHMSEETKKKITMKAAFILGCLLVVGGLKKESRVSNRQESDFAVVSNSAYNRIAKEIILKNFYGDDYLTIVNMMFNEASLHYSDSMAAASNMYNSIAKKSIVEDANGEKHINVKEMTWQINGEVVTKLMYVTNSKEGNIYVSVTDPNGKIVEKIDANGVINYYSAQVYPIEQGILDVISIKTYIGENLTFEEAVSYETELNAQHKIVGGVGRLIKVLDYE